MVIFTEFCSTEMGKLFAGIEVSHNLNYLWVLSPNYSTILSSSGIQEAAKWQFCSKIQVPLSSPDRTSS